MKLNPPNSINGRYHEKFLLGIIFKTRLFVNIDSNTLKTGFNGTLLKKLLKLKILVAIIMYQKHLAIKLIIFTKRSAIKVAVKHTSCHRLLVILGQLLQGAIIALI